MVRAAHPGSKASLGGARAGLSAVVMAVLAGCGQAPEVRDEPVDVDAALAALNAARSGFEAAVASGDMATVMAAVGPDAIMVQPGSADWNAMRAVAGPAPFAAGARISITPIETRVLSNEWAYDFGASVITYPSPETGETVTLRDTYLLVLRNEGEGWKPYREVASSRPPPGGWPGAAQ